MPLSENSNDTESINSLEIKPKKNIFLRIIKLLGTALGTYVVIGFMLILINPLFGWIVLYPVLYVQNLYSQITDSIIDEKVNELEGAEMIPPEKLTEANCSGLFGTETFNTKDAKTIDYSEKVNAKSLSKIATCQTPTGTLVFNSYYTSDSERTEVYFDFNNSGEVKKLITLNASFVEVAMDSNENYFILEPVISGPIVDRKIYLFDKNESSLKSVKRSGSIRVCKQNFDQAEKCQTWPINLNPYSTSDTEEKRERLEKVKAALNLAKELSNEYKISSPDGTYKGFCDSQIYNDEILKKLSDAGAGVRCHSNEVSYGIEGFLSGQNDRQVLCVDTTGEIKEDPNRKVSMIDFVSKDHYECQYAWPDGK